MNCNNVLFENSIILGLLSWADKYSNVKPDPMHKDK